MTTASAKAKGRRAQQRLRDLLLAYDPGGMYQSVTMGTPGSDIVDPGERLPFTYVEVRCREKYPSINAILEEMGTKAGRAWLYVFSRNNQEPLYLMNEKSFRRLFAAYATLRQENDYERSTRKRNERLS